MAKLLAAVKGSMHTLAPTEPNVIEVQSVQPSVDILQQIDTKASKIKQSSQSAGHSQSPSNVVAPPKLLPPKTVVYSYNDLVLKDPMRAAADDQLGVKTLIEVFDIVMRRFKTLQTAAASKVPIQDYSSSHFASNDAELKVRKQQMDEIIAWLKIQLEKDSENFKMQNGST